MEIKSGRVNGVLKLTLRELEVLRLLTAGMTSNEIATHLSRSKYTIDTHRRNMLKKSKMRNTAELVNYCLDKNLI